VDFTVLLPEGWARIPLDGRENARATALARAKTAGLAEPQRQAAIQKLQLVIREALRQARQAGGTDILLSLAELNGLPIVASCLVSYAEHHEPVPLDSLAAELNAGNGEVSEIEITAGPAIRHAFTEDPLSRVDYHLHIPGRTGVLTLAFSTPSGPLAGALIMLFDAIAESMRWQL
jgi:hypothetical protein